MPLIGSASMVCALGVAMLAAGSARASSDEAWKQFSAEVEAKCRTAVAGQLPQARIVVDPTGSEHYGLAILSGIPEGGKTQASFLCVYDKRTKTVEIGSEIGADRLKVTIPGKAKTVKTP